MKRNIAVLLAGVGVVLAGCVVTSVCPFYTQSDLVSEPGIIGSWINQKNTNEVWSFEQNGDLAYRFTLIEERKATVMEARAFKLRGQLFMDVYSLEQDIHTIPAHYLLKVLQVGPSLSMAELNHEWLANQLTQDPKALAHHFVRTGPNPPDRRVVLTASTAELQAFILRQMKNDDAWKESFDLHRAHGIMTTARAELP
jgi:hypothetical protein